MNDELDDEEEKLIVETIKCKISKFSNQKILHVSVVCVFDGNLDEVDLTTTMLCHLFTSCLLSVGMFYSHTREREKS